MKGVDLMVLASQYEALKHQATALEFSNESYRVLSYLSILNPLFVRYSPWHYLLFTCDFDIPVTVKIPVLTSNFQPSRFSILETAGPSFEIPSLLWEPVPVMIW
ncbi:hypothetical protein OnM2_071037 [Erysiphe neolycopersici]|uniref:Uncharacterized protein n=1 Tax=Erysiphe neolycopersici TaxID=212602 RepID=A0A420HK78_9PEZI|nr:hypothetical protein OnM2_071037 [Erysiphe neolycopersici]